MADKLEMPISIITRLVKEGACESLNESGTSSGVILGKEPKQAFSQLSGYFILYLAST